VGESTLFGQKILLQILFFEIVWLSTSTKSIFKNIFTNHTHLIRYNYQIMQLSQETIFFDWYQMIREYICEKLIHVPIHYKMKIYSQKWFNQL